MSSLTGATLHGVNLAGWLVLESWVTPELFAESGTTDDLSLMSTLGAEEYNRVVSKHRATFVTEDDFVEMEHRGFDAVRIPVPWYIFGDAGPYPEEHKGCVDVLDLAFEWANAHHIKVMPTIALTPGARYSSDGRQLVMSPDAGHRDAIVDVASALARRYAENPAFLGIEPLDQTRVRVWERTHFTDGLPMTYLRNFYRDAYSAIREVAGTSPIIAISDAGLPGKWRRFMTNSNYVNVWLDCHLYHLADGSVGSGPAGTRILVERSRDSLNAARSSGLPVMVGEWSAALPFSDSQMTAEGRIAISRVYTSAQLALFDTCPAWFYQTWKTSTRDVGWDARAAFAAFDRDMLD